jgi:hypothetical protein
MHTARSLVERGRGFIQRRGFCSETGWGNERSRMVIQNTLIARVRTIDDIFRPLDIAEQIPRGRLVYQPVSGVPQR